MLKIVCSYMIGNAWTINSVIFIVGPIEAKVWQFLYRGYNTTPTSMGNNGRRVKFSSQSKIKNRGNVSRRKHGDR